MKPPKESKSNRFYRRLLKLLPFDFRCEFGAEMEAVFEQEERDARQSKKTFALWWRTTIGLLKTAPREHLDILRADLAYALRLIRRSPAFAIVSILFLGLGVGIVTTAFSVGNAFFLRPLPFPAPEHLVHIWQTDRHSDFETLRVSVPNFQDWRRELKSFERLGGYFYTSFTLEGDGEPIQVQATRLTPDLLHLLGKRPAMGRLFFPEENHPGTEKVALISHAFWKSYFGGSPRVLDKKLDLEGETYRVVGVMPSDFIFPFGGMHLWIPLNLDPWKEARKMNGPLLVVGRLSRGSSIESAQSELDTLMRELASRFPEENESKGALVVPLKRALLFSYETLQTVTLGLFIAGIFFLLLVCANIGNLVLARSAQRTGEVSVRLALGARGGRLIRQFLTESLLLSLAGGFLGVLLALFLTASLGQSIPPDLYRVGSLTVDSVALLFVLTICIGSALFFGLAPAVQSVRVNVIDGLRDGGLRSSATRRRVRLRQLFVVSEIALAALLTVSSVLMLQTFFNLQQVDAGFKTDHILTTEIILPRDRYPDEVQQNLFFEELQKRVRVLPGVKNSSLIYPLPLNFESMGETLVIPGRNPQERPATSQIAWASTGYFDTMEIELVAGRPFSSADSEGSEPVAIINEELKRRYWLNSNPIGTTFEFADEPGQSIRIIGIVENTKTRQLSEPPQPLLYRPQLQDSTRRRFLMTRTAGDPTDMIPQVTAVIREMEGGFAIPASRTMEEVVTISLGFVLAGIGGLAVLGLGALLLAAIGLYGLISYTVAQRQREIGIRVALGAGKKEVLKLVLKQGFWLGLTGVALGLIFSQALTRVIESLFFGVTALNSMALVLAPLLLLMIILLASLGPVRKALRIKPSQTLRAE